MLFAYVSLRSRGFLAMLSSMTMIGAGYILIDLPASLSRTLKFIMVLPSCLFVGLIQ